MRKIIPYVAFFCLTGFTATSGLPLMADGCSGLMNKKADIKCSDWSAQNCKETARDFVSGP